MKAVVSVLCFLLINLSVLGLNYKVLFIGNSYTEVNNLPQIISDIASSMGDTIQISSYTPGDAKTETPKMLPIIHHWPHTRVWTVCCMHAI